MLVVGQSWTFVGGPWAGRAVDADLGETRLVVEALDIAGDVGQDVEADDVAVEKLVLSRRVRIAVLVMLAEVVEVPRRSAMGRLSQAAPVVLAGRLEHTGLGHHQLSAEGGGPAALRVEPGLGRDGVGE
jgi:hypothetical protein